MIERLSEGLQCIKLDEDKSVSERSPFDKPVDIIIRCKKELGRPAYIAGPMVRYSKLPFRELVRHYNVDIVYTPMILAREFIRNGTARSSDFSTNKRDKPLIVQVGCNNVEDLMRFVEMIHPFVDGIGLNCGCPIREQVREGIGAALMSQPELVSEMVRSIKSKYGDSICVETKIRIHPDINETIRYVKMIEESGVDFVTVHGRTKNTKSSQPADFEAIKIVKQTLSVPVVANGDCFSLEDAKAIENITGCDGIMSARGVLGNPALFANYEKTPWGAIELLMDYATSYGLPFRILQHHLSKMLTTVISRNMIKDMNALNNAVDLFDWFDDNFILLRSDEPGFGTGIEPPYRKTKLE